MIDCFLTCREKFRRRYIENIVPKKPLIHLEFGKAVHLGAEHFWRGASYEEAFSAAVNYAASLDITELNLKEREKWSEMQRYLPDLLGAYYESHDASEIDRQEAVELEWERDYDGIKIGGKIDRLDILAILYDIKTRSAIGASWREDAQQEFLRSFQLGLYDWAFMPRKIVVEVCVKPYRGSEPRIVPIELTEIMAYRARFKQQLKWIVREIQHYYQYYLAARPWPMSSSACMGKFGACDYLKHLCNGGDSPRNLEHFKPREEHLKLMGAAE
jgi:hypothetical protein